MNCRSLTAERKSILLSLLDAGKSHREAAEAVGVSRDTARYWAAKTGRLTPGQKRRQAIAAGKAAGLRPCNRCGRSLPVSGYYRCSGKCKECLLTAAAATLRTPAGKWRAIVASCRHRARVRNAGCELTPDVLQRMWDAQGGRCAYTGEPMTMRVGQWNTVSADRIDSANGGYTVGNVALCCALVNAMKRDMPAGEFRRLCAAVAAHPWPTGGEAGGGPRADVGGGYDRLPGQRLGRRKRRAEPLPADQK